MEVSILWMLKWKCVSELFYDQMLWLNVLGSFHCKF